MSSTGFFKLATISQLGGDVSFTNLLNMLTNAGTYGHADIPRDEFSAVVAALEAVDSLAAMSGTINGIELRISGSQESGGTQSLALRARIVIDGVAVGDTKELPEMPWGSIGAVTVGGASDTWSSGLTVSKAKENDFGISLQAESDGNATAEIRIALIEMNIHYTPPAPSAVEQVQYA
jgi:hypothetical protein